MTRANKTKGYSRNEGARLQLKEVVVVKNQDASGGRDILIPALT
jgi:hypothetical protein